LDSGVLPAAFALAGVLLGGFASHYFSLRREREGRQHTSALDHLNMLRSKYEELYSLVARWSMAMATNTLSFAAAMQGKMTYDDANDVFISSQNGREISFERIELLIDAYAPECRTAFDQCIEARPRINAIHSDFRRQYDQEGPSGRYDQLSPYTEAAIAFESHAENLKSKIIACLKQLK
jgi:hypothetical protein